MTMTKKLGGLYRKFAEKKLRAMAENETGKKSRISLKEVILSIDTDSKGNVTHISIDVDGEASREELKAASPFLKYFGI